MRVFHLGVLASYYQGYGGGLSRGYGGYPAGRNLAMSGNECVPLSASLIYHHEPILHHHSMSLVRPIERTKSDSFTFRL